MQRDNPSSLNNSDFNDIDAALLNSLRQLYWPQQTQIQPTQTTFNNNSATYTPVSFRNTAQTATNPRSLHPFGLTGLTSSIPMIPSFQPINQNSPKPITPNFPEPIIQISMPSPKLP